MEIFSEIRLKIGKAILKKKMAGMTRKVYFTNINQVKNIGIVWDASVIEDFAGLSRFYQKMHERNIEVIIQGFFPEKNLPDRYTAIRYLTCLRKKEMNFFFQPVSSESNTFIRKRFDILIDVNFNNLFPLRYISSLSNAGLKVGLFEPKANETPFDLMMEINKPVNIEHYLSQVIHYLEMINPETIQNPNK